MVYHTYNNIHVTNIHLKPFLNGLTFLSQNTKQLKWSNIWHIIDKCFSKLMSVIKIQNQKNLWHSNRINAKTKTKQNSLAHHSQMVKNIERKY